MKTNSKNELKLRQLNLKPIVELLLDEILQKEIKSENNIFDKGDILPIEDYVKFIVLNYQSKYPDTELSKKLGISRKSLWEKRKKYGIFKKK